MKELLLSFLLTLSVLFIPALSNAQIPAIDWVFTEDIDVFDVVTGMTATKDGGYLVMGQHTDCPGCGLGDNYRRIAIKLSSAGVVEWRTELDTEVFGGLSEAIELNNNEGYIVMSDYGAIEKLSISGVRGGVKWRNGFGLDHIAYVDNKIVAMWNFTQDIYIYDTNLNPISTYDATALNVAWMTPSLNSSNVLIGSNVGGNAKVTEFNLAFVEQWSKTFTGTQINKALPLPSKNVNGGDTGLINITKSNNYSRVYGERDYLFTGTKSGQSWIYSDTKELTFAASISRSAISNDGRIFISRSDSLVMLKGDLKTAWRTDQLKNTPIKINSDGSLYYFGGDNLRCEKTKPSIFKNANLFIFSNTEYSFCGSPNNGCGIGAYPVGLHNSVGQFLDFNNDGNLDYYQLANRLDNYVPGDPPGSISNGVLNALITQTGAQFNILNKNQYVNTIFEPFNFYIKDFDSDGQLEYFNNKLNNVNTTTGALTVQTSNIPNLNNANNTATSFADFDNNGLVDLFRNNDAIYLQSTLNTYTKLNSSTLIGIEKPFLIDINNDGAIDVIDPAGKSIYLNQNLVFVKHATTFTYVPVMAIELNGDGNIDFIVKDGNTFYTCINNGSLAFTYTVLNIAAPIFDIGDINNDGKGDLAGGNFVYFNNGSGAFSKSLLGEYYLPGLDAIKSVVSGNFDGDGDLDLAVSDGYQLVLVENNQTTPNQKPSTPNNLTVTKTGNSATLQWSASTDDTTPANSLTYNIYLKRDGQIIHNAHSLASGKRTLVDKGNAGFNLTFQKTNLPVGTYTWSVQAIDKSFEPSAFAVEQTFYVTNNPTNIAISNATIVENSAATIGALTTTDPDAGETFSYSLVAGTGSTDNALFKITGNALSALTVSSLNFETKSSYSIRIRTTDNRQGFFEKIFTIAVTNTQEGATDITLSASSIEENKPIGTEVATITNNDPDAGDVHLFTLVAGTGSTDNLQFEIVGNKLRSKAIFNYEIKNSYSIRIRTNDQQGQTFEKVFSISIIDLNDLTKPVLNLPSLISQTGFTLSWAAIEGATTYELEISTGNFSDFITGYNPKVISGTSAIVTSLTPGNIYKIRVRAVHLTFKSPNSDEIAQITKPANPVALDPAQIDVTSFKAGWTAPVGTNSYEFELSEGAGVFTTLPDYPKTVTGGALDLVVTNLTAKTVYKYRVRAINSAGASGNSNEKSVETLQIQNSNSLSISNPLVSGSKISVNVTGGSGTRVIKVYSKKITAPTSSFVEKVLTSVADAFETTVSTTDFDELGLEYYFTALDGSVTTPVETAHGYIYQTVGLNTFSAIPFSTKLNGTAGTYEMFSVPYEITEKSIASNFDELGAPDKTQWRLLRYQGGKYIEYPDNITTLDIGKGYWFNALQKVDIKTGEGKVTSANQATPFTITFAQGWNQIGNPYPFNIDWETIKTANSAAGLNSLWLFEGGKYVKKDVLASWKGAFVFSDTGGSVSFPVTAKTTSPGRTAKEELTPALDEAAWQLPVKLSLNGLEQISAVGMHPEARASKDKFDEITIPRFIDYLEMNTYHEEFFAHHFASDMVTTTNETSWLFTVSSNHKEGVATLTWNQQALHGNQSKIALIDLHEQTLVDMKSTSTYQFNWTEGRQFKILYSREGELLPGITMLGNAYPNPFTKETTIPFLLEEDQMRVEVSIYDLLGRKVKTLNRQNNKAGIHSMEWNGSNEQGSAVDGGLYLYQLRGDKGILSPPKRLIKQ